MKCAHYWFRSAFMLGILRCMQVDCDEKRTLHPTIRFKR
jgi:hypothetical protein